MANTRPITVRIERRLLSLARAGLALPDNATDSQIIRAALIFASGMDSNPTGIVTRANRTRVNRETGRIGSVQRNRSPVQ